MPHLAVVGHFSTWLLVAWVVWMLWASGQAVWYRRVRGADDDVVSVVPARTLQAEAPREPSGTLRAPGIPLRTMTPAVPTGAIAPPPPAAPGDSSPEHDDITPS
jgi:hypothetical protein